MLKARLSLLYLLQFAVWGCYLTSLGQLLGGIGLGREISWFYAAVGLVSLVMPALAGYISDRYIQPGKLLTVMHLMAAICMTGLWGYLQMTPSPTFGMTFALYVLFLSLYMPTIALANTTSFRTLSMRGEDTLRTFPRIRIWGTVGFILAMLLVNSLYWHDGVLGFTLSDANVWGRYRMQYTSGQLLISALFGFLTSAYSMTLPNLDIHHQYSKGKTGINEGETLTDILGWNRFNLFRDRRLRSFLIFAILAGVCLQISNGFVTPFITHFAALSEYVTNSVAANATMLFSISQISEAACILLVGISLRRFGIKVVLTIAMLAWGIRFGCLAMGDPGNGLWLLILSMVAYGVAFNYFNIAGAMYVDRITYSGNKGFGQGVLMLMSNGVGATLGMFGAGAIVNRYCVWEPVMTSNGPIRYFMGDWTQVWWIFAGYSTLVAVAIIFMFKPVCKPPSHKNDR